MPPLAVLMSPVIFASVSVPVSVLTLLLAVMIWQIRSAVMPLAVTICRPVSVTVPLPLVVAMRAVSSTALWLSVCVLARAVLLV